MVTVTLWSSCQGWQSELVEEKGIGFEAPRPFQGEERYSRRATHLVNETSTLLTSSLVRPSTCCTQEH